MLLAAGTAGATSCPALTPQNVFITFTNDLMCSPQNPYCYLGHPITFAPAAFGYPFACSANVFTWNFGDGTSAVVNAPAPVTHTYLSGGEYDVTLKIENSTGSITLRQVLYTGIYDVWGLPATFTAEHLSDFEVAFTPSWPAGITKATWDFGDGTPPWPWNSPARVTHSYATAGPHTVTLTSETAQGVVMFYSLEIGASSRRRAARH
ncbi:MAG TPA: PKD domain-containing protein [Thermoanaerobaculia bacterium]